MAACIINRRQERGEVGGWQRSFGAAYHFSQSWAFSGFLASGDGGEYMDCFCC
jgi:hypothetical protein